ncbi:cadherin-like and PC-esterase domain-containing protein 1 isoform X1 [Scomber scombrus]|uniref:Cadherin-like and PC-esterase domain-containing protein 1 isoform X1 n=1 Tax=Scomber scombrus TaxID=13677 RepID=A0AAV1QFT9_SCOSC
MRCLRASAGMFPRRRCCSGPLLLVLVAAVMLMVARTRLRSGRAQHEDDDDDDEDVRSGKPSDGVLMEETRKFITQLQRLHTNTQVQSGRRLVVVLTGRQLVSDTEVQLYQRVLQQLDYQVHMSRYAETSSLLRNHHGVGGWSLLLCLSSAERSCLRRISFSHLQPQQRVNLMPGLMEAFSDAGSGLCQLFTHLSGSELPMRRHACGSTNHKLHIPHDSAASDSHSPVGAPLPGLVAMVNVYVLVTSLRPLTSFLHDISVVTTNQEGKGRPTKIMDFLLQQFGQTSSHDALGQVKQVIGEVLHAAASTNQRAETPNRCVLCYQLLTFTLLFSGLITPVIIQVDADLTFSALSGETFDQQITKDLILEDSLHFLLASQTHLSETHLSPETHLSETHLSETHLSPETHLSSETHLSETHLSETHLSETHLSPETHLSSETHLTETHLSSETHLTETHLTGGGQYGGCRGTLGVCLSEEELLLLLQFQRQMKMPSAFQLLYPSTSSSSFSSSSSSYSSSGLTVSDLLLRIGRYYELQRSHSDGRQQTQAAEGVCSDPHLRQIYTDPPLTLVPPFSPRVKEYWAEVTFDTLTVRIRPEPISSACRVHLDEHRGPRMANIPVGLGNSRISILVTDDGEPEPVVMTIYTVHVYRESQPSLPMFGDHVTCSFLQDCGLLVQPDQSCGLESFVWSQSPLQTCSSGHEPGRWVVPCLSCSDNRTCDWREVAWQPDGCYHPLVDRPLLQDCMTDRKVLFLGDSTNRGMMYFLAERLNCSLVNWERAHSTLLYRKLNQGRSLIGYSYYPQFWLDRKLRPTFRQALLQLLHRSRPLQNSHLTVLVVGGVQWLNTNHLETVREVLDRESLSRILVVVKSLGMGFHLPVDGIRSLSLREIQHLHQENSNIITRAKHHGYEVIDTFGITMGRYKEFLQGRCACHFHEVEKLSSSESPGDATSTTNRTRPEPALSSQSAAPNTNQEAGPNVSSYHVRGPVNQVYSEILLSRLCPRNT